MFVPKAFYWGQRGARDNFSLQIRNITEEAYKVLGETPVVIGECGIPMDMKYACGFPYVFCTIDKNMTAKVMPSGPIIGYLKHA